jgi:hypothetical protein
MSTGARLQPSADVVSRSSPDGMLLVNLQTNEMLALNRTAARFWQLVVDGGDIPAVEQRLLDEFDVTPEHLSSEVRALASELERRGLLVPG